MSSGLGLERLVAPVEASQSVRRKVASLIGVGCSSGLGL